MIRPPAPAQQTLAQQQAPVFAKATDRGPNLNRRQSRRRITGGDENLDEFEFDWDIPDRGRGGPSPPSGPPSWGGTPIPETPPPRTIFEPTVFEAKVEAQNYDQKV